MKPKDIPDAVWYLAGAGIAYFLLKDQISAGLEKIGKAGMDIISAPSTAVADVGEKLFPVLKTDPTAPVPLYKGTDGKWHAYGPAEQLSAIPDKAVPSVNNTATPFDPTEMQLYGP